MFKIGDRIDFENLTKEQMFELGFKPWDESGLMLIPGNLFSTIPEGLQVIDIFGEHETFSKETHDDDTRVGCLAYGLIPKQ